MPNTNRKKNIIATLAYFDAMDYPLTDFEVWRHMIDLAKSKQTTDLIETIELLKILKDEGWVEQLNGFWFLKGRQDLVSQRIQRQKISLNKIRVARRWAAWLGQLPYVRAVLLTGTLAMKKASPVSDWDVLLVLEKKRIWIGRLLATSFLGLFGKWRHGRRVKDRFCLNHFITTEGLIMQEQNEFTAKEISFAIPLSGKDWYIRYQQLNESWLRTFQPNYWREQIGCEAFFCQPKKAWVKICRVGERLLEKTGLAQAFNRWLKTLMIRRIQTNPLTFVPGADIRYNDQALVFLPVPQRDKIIQQTFIRLTAMRR